jgi:hypothetical protein
MTQVKLKQKSRGIRLFNCLILSLLCLATVMDKVSAQSWTVARPEQKTPATEYGINGLDLSQMRPVRDPWSYTQQPFGRMMYTRNVRMSVDEGGRDSVGMVVVNFRVNSSTLERNYMDNARALRILDRTFRNRELLSTLNYIVITAGSSPEGSESLNEQLAARRALAVKSYIMWQFPYVDRDMIYTFSAGEDWDGLRKEIENDPYVPSQWEVLYLLDSHQSRDAKKAALKKIERGRAWAYISQFILPSLRGGAALSLYVKDEPQPVEKPQTETEIVVKEKRVIVEKIVTDTVYVDRIVESQPVKPVEPVKSMGPVEIVKKPLFAFKTNLLFDAGTAINFEMEIPMGRRWSIAGEWMFPWWLLNNDQIALQGGVGTLELRSYLGSRDTRRALTGWFLGLHGGWGYYDLEWKNEGYQGQLWYGGVSCGYAHSISKNGNWRMEYSLGLGYMQTPYATYIPKKDGEENWHLMRQKEATRLWLGPTRAKISLVWMLNRKTEKRGGE